MLCLQVTPGLKHLAQQLLGRTIRQDTQQHDMREDASVAMALALAELRQQPRDIPLLPPPLVRVPKEDLCKLLVHALPAGTDLAQVWGLCDWGSFWVWWVWGAGCRS